MKIRENGWLYRFTYHWWNVPPLYNVSRCKFLWSFALAPVSWLICPLLYVFVVTVGWIVRIVCALPALLLLGYRPTCSEMFYWFADENGNFVLPFVPIKRWPKWRGHHAYPVLVILILGALGLFGSIALACVLTVFQMGSFLLTDWGVASTEKYAATLLCFAVTLVLIARAVIRHTKTGRLLGEFVRTRTMWTCPDIEIE
jgi:hypothetical protein